MLIGVRGEGRPGLDMTGGTSGGRPGLSSQLCKMKDISSSVAPLLSSPLSTLQSGSLGIVFSKVCSACLSIYPPLYMFVVCGLWSGQYLVFSHFPLPAYC